MPNRFLLFAGDVYYPAGGWQDFVGAYPDLDAAIAAGNAVRRRWAHVVDLETLDEVWSRG